MIVRQYIKKKLNVRSPFASRSLASDLVNVKRRERLLFHNVLIWTLVHVLRVQTLSRSRESNVCSDRSDIIQINGHLKGHSIEFKYYADGIHSGLTPPG